MEIKGLRVVVKYSFGLLFLFFWVSVFGCAAVGPDYQRREINGGKAWNSPLGGGLTEGVGAAGHESWWSSFNDPILTDLIERAMKGSKDLKEARARVRESRARRNMSRGALFPNVDAKGGVTKTRGSENRGGGGESDLYSTGFDAGWELDIFGGVKRSVEASRADLEAQSESLNGVYVSLLAEVALNYIDARTYQGRLKVADSNLKAQKEMYGLISSRHKAGLSDELEVNQALYNLESTRSQIPTLRTGLEESRNRLAVLLGKNPGALHRELEGPGRIPTPPVEVAVGVPANALRRRPDIRMAERRLAARTARVGVATAELYPKFTLGGSIGLESLSAGDLLKSSSKAWSFGPGVSWKIFQGGAIRQNILVQSALQEQALIQYESAVLNALEEVENALVAFAEEQRRRESLTAGAVAAREAVTLARAKYSAGLTDFSNVLDAQRSLLSFEDDLALSNGTVASNLVRLYKALGGGWRHSGENER